MKNLLKKIKRQVRKNRYNSKKYGLDFEKPENETMTPNESEYGEKMSWNFLIYILIGILFGLLIYKCS